MFSLIIQFVISCIFLILSGYFLTKFAEKIAVQIKVGKTFFGMFVLAGVTSLPELSVDIEALKLNSPNLAVGDLFGSCLFNLMILAIADLFHRKPEGLFTYSSRYHAIVAIVSINIVSIAA
jgi:cation:H+ antiporter